MVFELGRFSVFSPCLVIKYTLLSEGVVSSFSSNKKDYLESPLRFLGKKSELLPLAPLPFPSAKIQNKFQKIKKLKSNFFFVEQVKKKKSVENLWLFAVEVTLQ